MPNCQVAPIYWHSLPSGLAILVCWTTGWCFIIWRAGWTQSCICPPGSKLPNALKLYRSAVMNWFAVIRCFTPFMFTVITHNNSAQTAAMRTHLVRFIFVLHHRLMAQCRLGTQTRRAHFLRLIFRAVIHCLIDTLGEIYVVVGK